MIKDQNRRLRPGETPPKGEPRRYRTRDGYIVLRWLVGQRSYVECLEHRLVAGVVTDDHVHHKNHQRMDNSPENLEILSPVDHAAEHGLKRRTWDRTAAAKMYEDGSTIVEIADKFGVNNAAVYRGLRREGVTIRDRGAGRRLNITKDVVEMRRTGASIHTIAKTLGVSTGPVTRVLEEQGFPPLLRGGGRKRTAESAAAGLLEPSSVSQRADHTPP